MKKRKILFFIESLAGGGAEKVLSTLVQYIDKERFEVTVCAIIGGGKYEEDVATHVHYHPIIKSDACYRGLLKLWYVFIYHLVYDWLPLSFVYCLFVPKGADVEVAFVEGFATKLLAFSNNKKSRKIAWVHCDFGRDHWTRRIFKNDKEEYSCYQKYHQIVTMSKTQKQSFLCIYPDLNVKVCYNPIDSSNIIQLSRQVINPEPRHNDIIRLVSIGRLAPVKAFDRLIRIIHKLKEAGITCELWLLGEGSERSSFEKYIKENSLEDCVTLFGFQNNPYKYLALCDLFVCSSLSEGFSTAISEALILGIPVVSTDVSGVREQLSNGCGIITENQEDALFEGIKSVLVQPEKLQEMKVRAIERGKDFHIEMLINEIEDVLS